MFASTAPSKALLQWSSQKIASRVPTTVSLTPVILTSGTARRCLTSPLYHQFYHSTDATAAAAAAVSKQRIRQNVARLYARRILEIAAAAAATQKYLAHTEAGIARNNAKVAAPRPVDWQNWSRKEWSQELLQSLGNNRVSRIWAATKRLAALAVLAAPLTVLYPLSLVSETAEAVSWKYALWGIEQAGPTFIKLFQWATTRQDLFSPEFCKYFGKLQDETVGHAWRDTVRILQEELGLPEHVNNNSSSSNNRDGGSTSATTTTASTINDYMELDHTPIGSGCIAQVYKGSLKQAVGQYPVGTEVAIKVQHPNIWHKVCADFYIMGMAARWLEALPVLNLEYLSLADTVRQFRDVMLPQLGKDEPTNNIQHALLIQL